MLLFHIFWPFFLLYVCVGLILDFFNMFSWNQELALLPVDFKVRLFCLKIHWKLYLLCIAFIWLIYKNGESVVLNCGVSLVSIRCEPLYCSKIRSKLLLWRCCGDLKICYTVVVDCNLKPYLKLKLNYSLACGIFYCSFLDIKI